MFVLFVPLFGIPLGLYLQTIPDEDENKIPEHELIQQAFKQSTQEVGVALQSLSERASILNQVEQQSQHFQGAVNQTYQSQQQLSATTVALEETVQQLEHHLALSNEDRKRLKKELLALFCKIHQIKKDLEAEKNKLQQTNTQLEQQHLQLTNHLQAYLKKIETLTNQLEKQSSPQAVDPAAAEIQIKNLTLKLDKTTCQLDQAIELIQRLQHANDALQQNNRDLMAQLTEPKSLPARSPQFFRT